MRLSILILLLSTFLVGCGKSGPTRAEALANYEAELREQERIEAEISDIIAAHNKDSAEFVDLYKMKSELGVSSEKELEKFRESIEDTLDTMKKTLALRLKKPNERLTKQKERVKEAKKTLDEIE